MGLIYEPKDNLKQKKKNTKTSLKPAKTIVTVRELESK